MTVVAAIIIIMQGNEWKPEQLPGSIANFHLFSRITIVVQRFVCANVRISV